MNTRTKAKLPLLHPLRLAAALAGAWLALASCGKPSVRTAPPAPAAAAEFQAAASVAPPATAPAPAPAQPAADPPRAAEAEQSARLQAMRKKLQQRGSQRAGSYLEQLDAALAGRDLAGAESALKAAIAQGTLTQAQIDEARGRVQAAAAREQAALVADARAKAEAAEQEATQTAAATPASRPASGSSGGSDPRSFTVHFSNAGLQSVRVFNADTSGREARYPGSGSPGNCAQASRSTAKDNYYSTMDVNVFAEGGKTAGTYGYEVKILEVTDNHLFRANDVIRYAPVTGTFAIPPGKEAVYLTWDKSSKRFDIRVFP